MDDRVYDVVVCAACATQLSVDADGSYDPCGECGSFEERTLRVRVTRDSVLAKIEPRKLLLEKIVYFGCVDLPGHGFYDVALRCISGPADAVVPWGYHVDGGLFPRGSTPSREGEAHVFHKNGWTAIAFPDRSVDSRGGSWSVFCIPAILDGPEALNVARAAFPTIFSRYEFVVTLGAA